MHEMVPLALSADIKQKTSPQDHHEYIIKISDEVSGLSAVVAIHSTSLGPAHGGTRMKIYRNEAEAIEDAINLSRAMSYKSALAGLPYGGAKGVIILSKGDKVNRDEILKAYAKKIEQLGGLFQTGTDVGLSDSDTVKMAKHTKYILGLPKKGNEEWSTSNTAARGVFYSIKSAVKHKYNDEDLTGITVGVKGVGKLGSHLVDLLVADGARVTIADTDPLKLQNIMSRHPEVKVVNPTVIHKEKLQIYAPCALGSEFDDKTIAELSCEIIAGGANNQLYDDIAGDHLYKNNILYIPDYVANAGGLIFVCEDLEQDGFKPQRVELRLANISKTVTMLLAESDRTNTPHHRVADHIARKRIRMGRNDF